MRGRKHAVLGAATLGAAALCVAAWAGVSAAVSGGPYSQDQQDCPANSDAWNAPTGQVDAGCHNAAVNVESGDGNTRYVEWGNNEVPNDPNSQGTPGLLSIGYPGYSGDPHSGCLAANTDGTGGGTGTGCGNNAAGTGFEANYDYYSVYCPIMQAAGNPCEDTNTPVTNYTIDQGGASSLDTILTQGLLVYFGMNDNTDNGEHDGYTGTDGMPCYTDPNTGATTDCNTAGAVNGASDGGGMSLWLTPYSATNTPSAAHPEGLLNYSNGACADGICFAASTQQEAVYHGCGYNGHEACASGTPSNADVFTNSSPASQSEPSNCSSGDATSEACPNGQSGDTYVSQTPTNENVDPGVQTYQDPDPQRSPAAPFNTPGIYAGTCGVYVNAQSDSVGPSLPSLLTGGAVDAPPGQWVGGGPTQSGC
ncbi:MAG TPA: hypothetical protein VE991_04410 [Acidimicrobiales bacterium]|nr:hypothetical protein [Acidimicrobiales bacterium]